MAPQPSHSPRQRDRPLTYYCNPVRPTARFLPPSSFSLPCAPPLCPWRDGLPRPSLPPSLFSSLLSGLPGTNTEHGSTSSDAWYRAISCFVCRGDTSVDTCSRQSACQGAQGIDGAARFSFPFFYCYCCCCRCPGMKEQADKLHDSPTETLCLVSWQGMITHLKSSFSFSA